MVAVPPAIPMLEVESPNSPRLTGKCIDSANASGASPSGPTAGQRPLDFIPRRSMGSSINSRMAARISRMPRTPCAGSLRRSRINGRNQRRHQSGRRDGGLSRYRRRDQSISPQRLKASLERPPRLLPASSQGPRRCSWHSRKGEGFRRKIIRFFRSHRAGDSERSGKRRRGEWREYPQRRRECNVGGG